MLFAPTPTVLAFHSSLALLTEGRFLLFRMALAEHCIYALMSLFASALLGGPVDATHDFDGVTALMG